MATSNSSLSIASYNCRGLRSADTFVCAHLLHCAVVCIQETWLLPSDFSKFDTLSSSHFCVAKSGMAEAVVTDTLSREGRPYGGVSMYIANELKSITVVVPTTSHRIVAVKICDCLIVNAYFPFDYGNDQSFNDYVHCLGVVENLLSVDGCRICVIVGNMNADFSRQSRSLELLTDFVTDNSLEVVDITRLAANSCTYMSDDGSRSSWVDHIITSNSARVTNVQIGSNFNSNLSDHFPIFCNIVDVDTGSQVRDAAPGSGFCPNWNGAGPHHFDQYRQYINSVVSDSPSRLPTCLPGCRCDPQHAIDRECSFLVDCLTSATRNCIPPTRTRRPNQKPWWDEDLDAAKLESCLADSAWRDAGRPRVGLSFIHRMSTRSVYRSMIKRKRKHYYRNRWVSLETKNLSGRRFHQSVAALTGRKQSRLLPSRIGNVSTHAELASSFEHHFKTVTLAESDEVLRAHQDEYFQACADAPAPTLFHVTVELLCKIVSSELNAKATPGHDGLGLICIREAPDSFYLRLAYLFTYCLRHQRVPANFCNTVTLPLVKDRLGSLEDLNNFRGIAISTNFAKMFEAIIIHFAGPSLYTNDCQFAYKPGGNTSSAAFVLSETVNRKVRSGTPVYGAFMDIKKAFDKVSHHKLLTKLVHRGMDIGLVHALEHFLTDVTVTVRFHEALSEGYQPETGIRQGGLLSGILFAIYLDDLFEQLHHIHGSLIFGHLFVGAILYADDMVLLATSATALQQLVTSANEYCIDHALSFNAAKCVCMRFMPHRYRHLPQPRIYLNDVQLRFAHETKYLGFLIQSSEYGVCISLASNCRKYYAAFNSIFASTDSYIPFDTANALYKQYCLSALVYGAEFVYLLPVGEMDTLSMVQNNGQRRRARLPYRSSVYASNIALDTDPFEIICIKNAVRFFRSLVMSLNSVLRYIALYDCCLLRRYVMHTVSPLPVTIDILHLFTPSLLFNFIDWYYIQSHGRYLDGIYASHLLRHTRRNPLTKALICHLLRPSWQF